MIDPSLLRFMDHYVCVAEGKKIVLAFPGLSAVLRYYENADLLSGDVRRRTPGGALTGATLPGREMQIFPAKAFPEEQTGLDPEAMYDLYCCDMG